MLYLIAASLAFATDVPEPAFDWLIPDAPARVEAECPAAVDLVVGQPLPDGLVGDDGLVRCYATAMPTSDLAHLLLVDSWARTARPRGERLSLRLAWSDERISQLEEAANRPTPFLQRPAVQRNLGRGEAILLVVAAVATVAVLDSQVIQ